MGRGSEVACLDCRSRYDLGYGSSATWLDHLKTIEEYDAAIAVNPDLDMDKNQAWRLVLQEHPGHRIVQWNENFADEETVDGRNVILGLRNEIICDVTGFARFVGDGGAFWPNPPGPPSMQEDREDRRREELRREDEERAARLAANSRTCEHGNERDLCRWCR